MRQSRLESAADVEIDTPLRLSVAAKLAFPDGSVTESSLKREARRGRLTVERIAGKLFTTLGHVQRMREACRVEAKVPISGSGQGAVTAAQSFVDPHG